MKTQINHIWEETNRRGDPIWVHFTLFFLPKQTNKNKTFLVWLGKEVRR